MIHVSQNPSLLGLCFLRMPEVPQEYEAKPISLEVGVASTDQDLICELNILILLIAWRGLTTR